MKANNIGIDYFGMQVIEMIIENENMFFWQLKDKKSISVKANNGKIFFP